MTLDPLSAFDNLKTHGRKLALLGSCSAVLGWDEQTGLPPAAANLRGDQLALLAGLRHEQITQPNYREWLEIALDSPLNRDPESDSAAILRALKRDLDRARKLPQTLVEELARTTSIAQSEWVAARAENHFNRFKPWLEKIFELKRQESACLKEGTDAASPYDPLLDEYEPGLTTQALEPMFSALKAELKPLVDQVAEHCRGKEFERILKRSFPTDRQRVFCEAAAAGVGFDFSAGRLDIAAHPFCSGFGPGDCRITTHYHETSLSDAFYGVLHEVGHGLYEQGLPADAFGTPLGESVSLGVHESQSRLWENLVGRDRGFWTYWLPIARGVFHEAFADVSLDAILSAVNVVEPSLIRIRADESTYNQHIIVRFELERDLIQGDLAVADVPAAWRDKYQALLGVTPSTDAEGCMQDIHWSAGLIGYFPTYTLGNLYAARLFQQAEHDLGDLQTAFSRGDFAGLLGWLRDRIHRHGRRFAPADLIRRAAPSAPTGHKPLIDMLRARYQRIHGI